MKKFTKQEIIELYGQVTLGEISFSRMVEILNERVSKAEEPVRKFKKGDKVRIKDGVSSKTHEDADPYFVKGMDEFIGHKLTVIDEDDGCVSFYEDEDKDKCRYLFNEDWLEPYVEELKKGDLTIFWDDDKEYATIRFYERLNERDESYRHTDQNGCKWENAIKFESVGQYKRLIKGEI